MVARIGKYASVIGLHTESKWVFWHVNGTSVSPFNEMAVILRAWGGATIPQGAKGGSGLDFLMPVGLANSPRI